MNEILIIIVIYNIKIRQLEYLDTLSGIDILIYDNSLEPQEVGLNYHYIHDKSNSGVSKAYNKGIELARNLNKKFVILLDQDTKFNMQILDTYNSLKIKYKENYIYAPVMIDNSKVCSPFLELKNRNLHQKLSEFSYKEIYDLTNKSLINSGLMIPLRIIDKIGYYNENIKLDFSDIDFINRYKQLYSKIILINIYIEHSISGSKENNRNKEINRFKYYCNGARELNKDLRICRMVFFRTFRLILKYKTTSPIFIVRKYFLGDYTI